jgi:hypothetical protein
MNLYTDVWNQASLSQINPIDTFYYSIDYNTYNNMNPLNWSFYGDDMLKSSQQQASHAVSADKQKILKGLGVLFLIALVYDGIR